MRQLSDHRADAALSVIVFAIIVVLEFGGILVTIAERTNPDANIKTSSDAIWWAFVTITTIGYGDRYPTTNLGRFFSLFVMTTGVGLFGVLTGYLANAFLAPSKPKEAENEENAEPVDKQEIQETQSALQESQAMVAELKGLVVAQEKAQSELRALVAQLTERL
jgi:voltage-gated potassium channel